ncbi:MAG: RDD family protein [Bacteroidales bacterium]|jgi:uncharacterized RDD family membrane protein YckC|nr:RDD family protein [Bacteroidales bacterium]
MTIIYANVDSIDILSGQNVMIKYQAASIGKRFCAWLLDWIMLSVYAFAVIYTLINLNQYPSTNVGITLWVIAALPVIFFHFLCETIFGGQTPGKMALNIKVTNLDGTPTQIGGFFLRWLLMPVDLWLDGIVGLIAIANSKYSQRLGDMAAGTIVVKTNIKSNIDMYNLFFQFAPRYTVTYPNVELLSDSQISFIINLLIEALNTKGYDMDLAIIAKKVRKILNINDKKMTTPVQNKTFLKTIAMDYNFLALNGF